MKTKVALVAVMSGSLVLAGCATTDNQNTTRGAAIGAVAGAIAGKATGNHKNQKDGDRCRCRCFSRCGRWQLYG